VGLLGGAMGRGRVLRLDAEVLELTFVLDQAPPPKLPLTLVVALPRPKVLNRVVAAAASLGAARLVLLNAWKVEKAYWASPRLQPESLRQQLLLGLEQAKDTVLPELQLARLFRPFVEDDLPGLVGQGTGLGLSLCYAIVKAHEGSIDIQSTPGAGTQVQVCFPLDATFTQEPCTA